MSWTKTFIHSLDQWNENCLNKNMELEDILFQLGYFIGQKDMITDLRLSGFEDRINYLVREEKMKESFLIQALLNETTILLTRMITNLGEAICTNEQVDNSIREEHGASIPQVKKTIEKLKDKSYIIIAEYQIDVWNKIVQENFSLNNKRKLEAEDFSKLGK